MKKKIIFTVTNDLVYDRRMIRIGESLGAQGYEIVLVGRLLNDSKPFDNEFIQPIRFKLIFNKGKFFYIEYNIRLFFWLIFQRFDIVCGIDLDTILPCYWVSKLKRKPCVYDAHELFTEVPELVRRPNIQKIWLALEKFIIPRLHHCYTVSQSVADEFERRYNSHFELIRNLPNRSLMSVKPPKNELPIILYQGNLNEGRGLENAIEAMQEIDNAVLWLAGEGDLSQILRGMVKDLKLENKVKFLGYIEPKNLPLITQQATIGLNILEAKGLSYQYSLANKFLDYIQSGIPQICIQFIEYQRINHIFEVAILIEKSDTTLLVNALKTLLSDKNLYNEMQYNCRIAADELNWENEQKKLIAFYEKI